MFDSFFLFPVPTRLFALKHGANLVWGPEIVDKAILHSTREVDRMYEKLFLALTYRIKSSCNGSHFIQWRIPSHLLHPPY